MRQLGKIKCIEVPASTPTDKTVVLFHGYGADAFDLQTLSDVIQTPWPCNWIFPQGILEVPIGPGWTGRAWWNINIEALQQAAASGQTRDLSIERPANLDPLRKMMADMIKDLRISWSDLILGGFSQGAMLATDTYLNAPEAPAGLIILSGALVNKKEWVDLAPKRAGKKYFISHGQSDQVLSHKGAQQLETMLNQAGMKGTLQSFSGGHEIPPQIIPKISEYLKSI
jgi:phospholipase/carboxylesterase